MTVLLVLLGLILLYWSAEAVKLRRARRALPIRIHVNGSRGKSSVTRLLAAALRESGIPAVAKTTGSRARFVHADGSEEPVIRLGTPNICEQVSILDRARREGARAIVMECMALRPELQRVAEKDILRSTIGVITNVRADHLDVMGPTTADVAVALSGTIPRGGKVVLGEGSHLEYLSAVAARRGAELMVADPLSLPEGALNGFGYLEHEENVAAALLVTRELGIPDEVALRGMCRVRPDPGACTRWDFRHEGRRIEFYSIFAANDVESTVGIWERLRLGEKGEVPTFALVNLRGDRVDRSLQFAEAVETKFRADYYVLVGDFNDRVLRRYEKKVPPDRFLAFRETSPAEIFKRMGSLGGPSYRVGGVGNIGGLGHAILNFVSREEGAKCS